MISPETIGMIIKEIYREAPGKNHKKILANEAAIYLKTVMICESKGIKEAMDYYFGWHSEDEYQEFVPGELIVDPMEG